MTKIKPGLGRGLGALINPKANEGSQSPITVNNDDIKTDDGKSFDILAKIPINSISPNPFQPRSEFDQEALDDLKNSILENGLIQPITVRRSGSEKFELISGERRWRSCKEIGLREIPAYVIKVDTKEGMVALSLIENLQREDLNSIEIANSYKRLLDECGLSQDEIAKRVGKNRTTITNSLRLLKLPKVVQDNLIDDKITAGHARALLSLPNQQFQIELLEKIIKESLSVRKVEALVKDIVTPVKTVIPQATPPQAKSADVIARREVEDRLRGLFGTKVICKQKKDGAGEITIEFYSNDELDRLFDMFDEIENAIS